MKFKDIFVRDIDRHMDSVIKSDDGRYVADELEEYVLTPEVRRFLTRFCDEYNNPRAAGNGAWISGFYGSGKSHLLKMLSYLLENQIVGGKRALDYILPKIQDDAMLASALERACARTPSESILFNVGGKSDAQRRDTGESLLNAFIKVLNEQCGYFAGEQAHVAALERDLDRAGLYENFKDEIRQSMGRSWETVRKNPAIFAGKVSAAYDRVCDNAEGTSANIFKYYLDSYHPTPEDFAQWCLEYIEKREKDEPGFHLNFFVDEMGQYIADSVPLLQMLQDIVENLNTRCGRRAWLVVVSQEEMADITGRLEQNAAGQFSKIQARFTVLMKIPSNDANTVVRERLLAKSDDALPALDRLYDAYSGDFKVLLDFPDGAKHYRAYADREDFASTYPLVGYQFDLFHEALTGLSEHAAFTGEYVSTGARNMLGTTHRVLVSRKDEGDVERGDLISFDEMFEGLRDELKSEVFNAISQAAEHFPHQLGVRVLKALLLVKYCNGFKATPKNLAVLLYSGFSEDQGALEEQIVEVCQELDAQTYIRRTGDAYEYLTDDEKDVEEEIKREAVSDPEVSKEIGKMLQEVIGQTKVRYTNGDFSTTFSYDLLIDGQAIGAQRSELKVNVLTDLMPEADEGFKFAPVKQLHVALPRNTRLTQEARLWKQTVSYVGLNHQNEGRKQAIIDEKRVTNEQRRRELIAMLADQLDRALYGTAMRDVTDELTGQGKDRFECAALQMVKASYPHLRMLDMAFSGKTVYDASTGTKLLPGEPLAEYCREVLDDIRRVQATAAHCIVGGTTDNALEARFRTGDHGWPVESVRQAVGILALNNLVECTRGDEPLEGPDLAAALSTGRQLGTIRVKPVTATSPEKVEALRAAYRRITGMDPVSTDSRELADALADQLRQRAVVPEHIEGLPFEKDCRDTVSELRVWANKGRAWLIENIETTIDDMAKTLENLGRMQAFANGNPGQIFARASRFLMEQASNIAAVPGANDAQTKLRVLLADETCYTYSSAPKANSLVKNMNAQIDEALAGARSDAHRDLDDFSLKFRLGDAYRAATDEVKRQVDSIIAACAQSIDAQDQITVVRGLVQDFKNREASRLYSLVEPKPEPAPNDDPDLPASPKPSVKTVPYHQVSIPARYKNGSLSTQVEVDAFIDALRADLMERIDRNEKIIL
jgi:hypothetical protein